MAGVRWKEEAVVLGRLFCVAVFGMTVWSSGAGVWGNAAGACEEHSRGAAPRISEIELDNFGFEILGDGGAPAAKSHFDAEDLVVDSAGRILYRGKEDAACFEQAADMLRKVVSVTGRTRAELARRLTSPEPLSYTCNGREIVLDKESLKTSDYSPENGLTRFAGRLESPTFQREQRIRFYDAHLARVEAIRDPGERFYRLIRMAKKYATPALDGKEKAIRLLDEARKSALALEGYEQVLCLRRLSSVYCSLGMEDAGAAVEERAAALEGTLNGKTAAELPEVEIRAPTAGEAFSLVYYLIVNIDYALEKGYPVTLPAHPLFRQYLNGSAGITTSAKDLRKAYVEEVYDPRAYDKGVAAVRKMRPGIERALHRVRYMHRMWNCTVHKKHLITFTLIGVGDGDPRNGIVNIGLDRTSLDFPEDLRVFDMVVHEIIHTVFDPLAEQKKLTLFEMERGVDLICHYCFRDLLPEYKMQRLEGVSPLDEFVDAGTILNGLPGALDAYVAAYPRGEGEKVNRPPDSSQE